MTLGQSVVQADDTEVFFAPQNSVGGIYPNIMFIIDTSGSMGWSVSGTNLSRLEVVQQVMDQVLSNITNVNAGLMRFNNGLGGGVLYPVRSIDQQAIPQTFQDIKVGSNDGVQTIAGTISTAGSSIVMNGNSDIVGLRFEQLSIPQGATILSANVVFTADTNATGASDVTIAAENVDSSSPLTGVVNELGVRYNTNSTAAKVPWSIANWNNGQFYSSSDISSVVQQVTDRSGWCGGNNFMVLIKSQSGALRSAYSKEGVDANIATTPNIFAPRIKVTYSTVFPPSASKCMTNETVSQIADKKHDFEIWQDGTYERKSKDLDFYLDGSNKQQGVGMAFQNVNVPQGANITYAYLSFTANKASTGVSTVNIEAVNQANISNLTDYAGMDSAPKTVSVPWTVADNWLSGNRYNSVDISSIITQIVNNPGWNANNSMALFIRGSSGDHTADSLDGGTPPKLHIGYSGNWTTSANTIRDDLKTAVASLVPSGGTPISSTYAEAGAYYKGDKIFYGQDRDFRGSYTRRSEFRRVSHPLSYDASGVVFRDPNCTDANLDDPSCGTERILGNPNYISPIVESCQTNHIVFLTDGAANSHFAVTGDIYNAWSGDTCQYSRSGDDCSIKMAAWLHNNDVSPSIPGKQTVTTHMIGFGPGADPALMEQMATAGGGGYYSPADQAQLTFDVSNIVNSISNINTTFVTAGVTVNQYNRLSHNDELFFSLFSPQAGTTWPGNIKRYRLAGGQIVDANSLPAINPLNAEFKGSARSFWSTTVDGNEVEKGGTAEQLLINRKVFSNISSNNLSTDPGNQLKQNNNSVTTTMLGGVTPQRRDTILYWIEGYDVNNAAYIPSDPNSLQSTPARKKLGDPLHSQPTVLQYNDSAGGLLTSRIYVGTNHGYLHSFDVTSGQEAWAFVPKELLPRLDGIISKILGAHSYGLDGSVAIYVLDNNKNGAVDPGEKALLYIGQRRGGNSYFAFDISDPDAPKLLFKIKGGTTGFSQLGQTWSTPTITKMNLAGVNSDKLVMIFGGGYDEAQDVEGIASVTDSIGKAVFIVDALSGNLLWDSNSNTAPHGGLAGPISTMNSVPSQVTALILIQMGLLITYT
ncbi:MAG: PilC/PilY family type IV pilus protein [Enterobacterales bacterium]|nr:PilC/PilY family type IV pilus protein [Enterobacterales bacterium]